MPSHCNLPSYISNFAFYSLIVYCLTQYLTHFNMFSKLALFAVAIFAAFVAALPRPGEPDMNNSCNGGQIYCCM